MYFVSLQRTAKRLRLSKVKVAKYYDSGSLVVFYLVSLVWGINYIIKVSCQLLSMYRGSRHILKFVPIFQSYY